MLIGFLFVSSAAAAETPKRVSPAEFGRVFRANRHALVRVKGRTWSRWSTGFVVGARGEILFSALDGPTPELAVRTPDGTELSAVLLGYDRDLALGVARIRGGPRIAPLDVADRPVSRGEWVIAMTHDAKGLPEPFAGVVSGSFSSSKARPKGVLVAGVDVPGQPGAPVLSTRGMLVGVAIDRGKRRTRMISVDSLVPFLKAVVLADERSR